ncbi:MAG: tRNA pseudouridine(55) synthase TruB [Candidatus Eisenbacteria bacterium]|nr:tRNA pseudouridine(55) synthase TruB [Candidatus Latescibacterota bacterium]MBD3303458.1 tRNA pseudouridine(55) synthase TruB [Candidatus Eisenbacteria bacterium]
MNGFVLPVDKPESWTSHDAVQRLRRILETREVGHAGTLDPFATGILACGVGRGTKILSYLLDLPKEYVGTLRLGRVTDSGDRTGKVLREEAVGPVDLERAREVAVEFVGRREQVPPMTSALKRNGRRLYQLARKGIEVEREPRLVAIHRFEILDREADRIRFAILCGRGTYIRTLIADFGERLGPGASVETLRRTKVGPLSTDGAVDLEGPDDRVRAACAAKRIPLAQALAHLPSLVLRPDWIRRIRNGIQPPWRAVERGTPERGCLFRLVGPEGELVAVARRREVPGPIDGPAGTEGELRLERVF